MTHEDRETMAIEEFFRRTKDEGRLPDDLYVPKFRRWNGAKLQPMPRYHCQVEYAEGVREEAEQRRREDATLEALRGFLDFTLDEESNVLRVCRKQTK
jgi:hypothetical protein